MEEVCSYFGRIHQCLTKKSKIDKLSAGDLKISDSPRSLPESYQANSTRRHEQIVTAIGQYEKDTSGILFALKFPLEINERKDFIKCSTNIAALREYLYLKHDIFTSIDELQDAFCDIKSKDCHVSNKEKPLQTGSNVSVASEILAHTQVLLYSKNACCHVTRVFICIYHHII